MNKFIIAMLGSLALTAAAQDAPVTPESTAATLSTAAAVPAEAAPVNSLAALAQVKLPDGVVTDSHPLKRALVTPKSSLALFRPSPNMPEVTHEGFLRGMTETNSTPDRAAGAAKSNKSPVLGYLPKLKVLPCAVGCKGSKYDEAVSAFIKGYRGAGVFQDRGELIVQVRWFNVRPFLMRQMPYSADQFGVSMMLEGKLVSFGLSSGVGKSVDAAELASDLGARLAVDLAFTMGLGKRSTLLNPYNSQVLGGVPDAIIRTSKSVKAFLGDDDMSSRMEPATEAHQHLLPAIDGIQPGEVNPITEVIRTDTLLLAS